MTDTITYQYNAPSGISKRKNSDELLLAKYNEATSKDVPCYFWGKLKEPFITAKCLIILSNIVKSSFNLSPFQMANLKDPIVTAGNGKIRFEGFSHCAGVYARVDVLPEGHDGEFLENGTTNVDFNQPMINALGRTRKNENLVLSVGEKEVAIHKEGKKVVERKVPLPTRWIKSLTSVQLYMADTEEVFSLNRNQSILLFRSIPKGKPKKDYYLGMRGNRPFISPVKMSNSICVGGIQRLRLIESLLPYADKLKVFAHKSMQSTSWQLAFGPIRFTISLSRDTWRGFSGEGAGLEALIEDLPDDLVARFDHYSYANQEFNPAILAINEGLSFGKIDNLSTRLSAMGLLGYDLDENQFFHRRLPFKLGRIISLNPRLKNAEKLLADNKVEIVNKSDDRIEARVAGSGVRHTVVLSGEKAQCTCTWYSQHQGERGLCKHILAVKKKLTN